MARQIAARGRLCAGAGWPLPLCSPALWRALRLPNGLDADA